MSDDFSMPCNVWGRGIMWFHNGSGLNPSWHVAFSNGTKPVGRSRTCGRSHNIRCQVHAELWLKVRNWEWSWKNREQRAYFRRLQPRSDWPATTTWRKPNRWPVFPSLFRVSSLKSRCGRMDPSRSGRSSATLTEQTSPFRLGKHYLALIDRARPRKTLAHARRRGRALCQWERWRVHLKRRQTLDRGWRGSLRSKLCSIRPGLVTTGTCRFPAWLRLLVVVVVVVVFKLRLRFHNNLKTNKRMIGQCMHLVCVFIMQQTPPLTFRRKSFPRCSRQTFSPQPKRTIKSPNVGLNSTSNPFMAWWHN